jgi:hypothetical protein
MGRKGRKENRRGTEKTGENNIARAQNKSGRGQERRGLKEIKIT